MRSSSKGDSFRLQRLPQLYEQLPKIVAKAWSNSEFKDRLMKDPMGVLESYGIEIPSGIRFVVNESTKDTCYLTLPEKPEEELSEDELESIAVAIGFPLGVTVW